MRITTFNANGIRAAVRKGFVPWLERESPDVLCIQELKAHEHQIPVEVLGLAAYPHRAYAFAQKAGYSGVAVFSKRAPDAVTSGLGWPDLDAEGRYVRMDFGRLSIGSLYVPSGTTGPARQSVKDEFLLRFLDRLAVDAGDGREHILCGDFNVAPGAIDTFDPVRNASVTGHLPHERLWFESIVDEVGWVDAFRAIDPEPRRYTWWSNFQGAFERNLGWRIDHQLVTPGIAPFVRAARIECDVRFSDHAPLTIDYGIELSSFG